jgi:nitrite reductase (NO-forming)
MTVACCDACARPPKVVSRSTDRRITVGGLGVAVSFAVLAAAASLLPSDARAGLWLPLHLVLAGAAGTAIAAVLPFFTSALRSAPPAPPMPRIASVALVSGGALVASGGFVLGVWALALVGGSAYIAGMGVLGIVAFTPVRRGLGVRRPIVEAAYAVAIVQVIVGVAIVVAYLAGAPAVLERWGVLKPAHAWLNVFGFISVVIAATLVHLGPTVAGTRIRHRSSAVVALNGLMIGPVVVALGFAAGIDVVARLGALVAAGGAVALVAHSLRVHADRGRWTTDAAWHRLTSGSLLIAPAWLAVAVSIGAWGVVVHGAQPEAWSRGAIAAPLALGWVVQVLVGSWSHLIPAIGPGDAAVHARQRAILGWGAGARLVALNVGVGALTVVGVEGGSLGWVAVAGFAGVGVAVGVTVATFVGAVVAARR